MIKMERKDRNAPGCGLMAFIRSDLPVNRRKYIESSAFKCTMKFQ